MKNMKDLEFSWGESVQVRDDAPPEFRPGTLADVVAITVVETKEQASRSGLKVGSEIYLIEFGDGYSVEILGKWLQSSKD